jgi:hypothetical protein
MGLLRNLAKKVVGAAKAVHEEANHPGRPPAHKVSGNPFHQDPPKPAVTPAPKAPEPRKAESASQERTGRPWYLDGTQDGWDETDPT